MQNGGRATYLKPYIFLILGDAGVGRTSVAYQYVYKEFGQVPKSHFGPDILFKTMPINGKKFSLRLLDTSSDQLLRPEIPEYIRDCDAAIIIFDISLLSSFNNIEKWVHNVRDERGSDLIIMLVGNKIDLVHRRVVSFEECLAKANYLNVQYMEVSAKTGSNINQLFWILAQEVLGSNCQPTWLKP